MIKILTLLVSLFSGPLSGIAKEIRLVKEAQIKAENETQRLVLDERLAELEAQRSVIIASQPDLIWRLCRAGFAVPFIIYINKIVVWDKVFGLGVTDNLSADLWYLLYMIVGGFFVETTTRIIRRPK